MLLTTGVSSIAWRGSSTSAPRRRNRSSGAVSSGLDGGGEMRAHWLGPSVARRTSVRAGSANQPFIAIAFHEASDSGSPVTTTGLTCSGCTSVAPCTSYTFQVRSSTASE